MQYETYNFSNTPTNIIKNLPIINDPIKEEFYQTFFTEFEEKHEFLLNTYLATEAGEFYLSNIPPTEVDLKQYDPRQTEWYQQAIEADGEIIWTTPYIDTGTGKSTITLAKTLTGTNGQTIGVVGFDFDMHKLSVLIREEIRNTTLLIAVITLIVGISVISLFVINFTRALTLIKNNMAKVADGDLSIEKVHVKRKDEIGELIISFNSMVANLKELVEKVIDTSQHVSASAEQLSANADETTAASEQIASSIQEVASGAEMQLDKVKESNQIVNKISEDILDISTESENAAKSSLEMSQKAQLEGKVVRKAIEQMESIATISEHTTKVISDLYQKSGEIEEIVNLINGIADQTNLLALNAAIEAARAGEHGKGFAVVADEVRKLAEQSSRSTKKIAEIIKEIHVNTQKAVESMDNGKMAVNKGSELVGEVGTSFSDVALYVTEISKGASENTQSIKKVNQNTESLVEFIRHVSNITEQTTAQTQEVATATEEQTASMEEVSAATKILTNMALELQEVASKFRV